MATTINRFHRSRIPAGVDAASIEQRFLAELEGGPAGGELAARIVRAVDGPSVTGLGLRRRALSALLGPGHTLSRSERL